MRYVREQLVSESEFGERPDAYAVIVADITNETDDQIIDFVATNMFCFCGASRVTRWSDRAIVRCYA